MHKELHFHKTPSGHGEKRITGIYLFLKLVNAITGQASQQLQLNAMAFDLFGARFAADILPGEKKQEEQTWGAAVRDRGVLTESCSGIILVKGKLKKNQKSLTCPTAVVFFLADDVGIMQK